MLIVSLHGKVNECVLLVHVALPLIVISRSVIQRIRRENDKMRGLSSILSRLRNEFNKFNNKGARMLDSFYRMTLKDFEISFLRENA